MAKATVLLLGGGAVGAIAAVNIESGGLGAVTAVLRSNYQVVNRSGYYIESVDHGQLRGWKPTRVVNSVPNVPFDYIVCTTKNLPDIPPSLSTLIESAVEPGHTVIVLLQNGLNIEKPIIKAFPHNTVLSGVSVIDCHEAEPGHIIHKFPDDLHVGAFPNPNFPLDSQIANAKNFVRIYCDAGKTKCEYSEDVALSRWRKLVFNAAYNPICAITGLDDGRIRSAGAVEGLVRPAMTEIVATAKALGHDLPDGIIDTMIHIDPVELHLKPSMQCDAEKLGLC